MTLTLVTDCRRACPEARTDRALVAAAAGWLAGAVAAGIDVIQIREHDLSAGALLELTRTLADVARGTATQVVVNNRADVALAGGADGVHLRDDGWPAPRVRALSARWRISRSIHAPFADPSEARDLDSVTYGAVFASGGKPSRGCEALRAVVVSSPVPVVAIGGIGPASIGACLAAGAAGVAAITVFLPPGLAAGALGPRDAIARLRAAAGIP